MTSDELRTILRGIETQARTLTPEAVVSAAQDAVHPLHDRFEWDDGEAGRQFRLQQARQLINSVRMTVTHHSVEISVPAYVKDDEAKDDGGGYVATPVVVPDSTMARSVVNGAARTAMGHLTRVQALASMLTGGDNRMKAAIKALTELINATRND